MGLPRDLLVEMLTAPDAIPADVNVIPYSRDIAAPERSTVMVRIDEVWPSTHAMGVREYRFALVLIAAKNAVGKGDDELDGLLEDVLSALESEAVAGAVTFTSARRSVYGTPDPTNPAYEVNIIVTIKKE